MKLIVTILRTVFGTIFFVFGLNGFLHFLPYPTMSQAGSSLIQALAVSGYFLPTLKIVEIVTGLSLLLGRFVPISLILIAPVTIHIFLFHIFLDPSDMFLSVFLITTNIFLGYAYRNTFKSILKQNVKIS